MAESELEKTARQRMERLGLKSIDELLEHDRISLLEIAFPSEGCLEPHELQKVELLKTIVHALHCPMCAALAEVHLKLLTEENGPSK